MNNFGLDFKRLVGAAIETQDSFVKKKMVGQKDADVNMVFQIISRPKRTKIVEYISLLASSATQYTSM